MNFDVRGLALKTAHRLVDHDARVRQAESLALRAGGEQKRTHAGGLADAQRRHIWFDVLHGVVDRHAGSHRSPRRIDIEIHVLVRVFGLQKEQLRNDQVGGHIVDRADQEHHALLQQTRVNVVGTLSTTTLFDDHRHHPETLRLPRRRVSRIAEIHICPSVRTATQLAPPISSSKEIGLSVDWALANTHATTLSSTTSASTCAIRWRSP